MVASCSNVARFPPINVQSLCIRPYIRMYRSKPESEDDEYDFADSYGAKYDDDGMDDQATEPELMADKNSSDDLDDSIEVRSVVRFRINREERE